MFYGFPFRCVSFILIFDNVTQSRMYDYMKFIEIFSLIIRVLVFSTYILFFNLASVQISISFSVTQSSPFVNVSVRIYACVSVQPQHLI